MSEVLSKKLLFAFILKTDLYFLPGVGEALFSLNYEIAIDAASLTCLILSDLSSPILDVNYPFYLKKSGNITLNVYIISIANFLKLFIQFTVLSIPQN